ncbi:TPA: hypothetical protein RG830_004122, partial [Vibrio vulnificus]|nr:hypothetical protein [Vibrio vulnificus]HDU8768310.1 hypothetical protein [Vibrio vulnificus]
RLIEDLVIELCVNANFISDDDVADSSTRFKWIQNAASCAIKSYALIDEVEGRSEIEASLSSFDELIEFCQCRAQEVVEFLSDKSLESAPYLDSEEGSETTTDTSPRLKLKGPSLF